MLSRYVRLVAVVVLCSLSSSLPAQTTAPTPTGPLRLESVTIRDRGAEVLIRFDRPISHGLSWIALVRDDKVVATVHPRLEAQPNVLFARIQTPMTGHYTVRWTVCPEGTNDRYDGEFPLTVGEMAASSADRGR